MRKTIRYLYKAIPLKRQLFSVVKNLMRPSPEIYKHLHFNGTFRVDVDNHHAFRMEHYGFELENSIFWEGLRSGWEKTSVSLWVDLVKGAEVIFDIGANTGVYSLIAKTVNPSARVVAVEPIKRVFERLRHNVEMNGYDIECLELAASSYDGEATVYDVPAEHVYSVTVNKNLNAPGAEVIPTSIKTARLDRIVEERGIGKIDLIKIDVETHEPEVLEGMGKYLGEYRPTMLIEILDDEVGRQVEALVESCGYLYFNIDEKTDSIRQVPHVTKSDYYNYLLCSEEVAARHGLTNANSPRISVSSAIR